MKRMIVSEIWEDEWFSQLNTANKLFFIYVITKCDQAGCFKLNLKTAEFFIGDKIDVKQIEKKVIKLKDGVWFVPNFIKYQHGTKLSRQSNFHKPVIDFVEKNKLTEKLAEAGIEILESPVMSEDEEGVVNEVRKYWRRLPSQYEVKVFLKHADNKYFKHALRECAKYNKLSIAYFEAVLEGYKKREAIMEAKSREEKARLLKLQEKEAMKNPEVQQAWNNIFADLKKELKIIEKKDIREIKK